ncbi:MAG: hypothetical protein E7260_07530 [Lachnospiraceae bacterium]|nr:hypothetical protein [Lachnospiraceae bacterium]
MIKKKWKLLLLLLLTVACAGCAQALQTASDTFDSLMGDMLGSLEPPYVDEGNVSIRILTATPTPGPTNSPTPTLSPTPTPTPDNVEPSGIVVDEWVYVKEAVNIREGWSTKFLIVGGLQANDQVHRLAILDNGWSKISYNGEVAYVNSAYLTTEWPDAIGTTHLDTMDYTYRALLNGEDVAMLGVKNILQKPDLPAGPEITCLTIVLNYLGDYVDKLYLAENFLTLAEPGTASPFEAYLGDPKVSKGSYGCYAPVIVEAANRYFAEKGNTNKKAMDVSGSTQEELLQFIADGTPVLVWGTTNLVETKVTASWEVDGELIEWRGYEHCTVLIGYNRDRETVIVADPLRGLVEFDMERYFKRYREQYESAVIISGN